MPDVLRQQFNEDLLISRADREHAARIYPSVSHVLDHPALRHCFLEYDKPARAAKSRSRRWGSTAIVLASLALFCAALELAFFRDDGALRFIALAGVIFGISSVTVGSLGILYGRAKREWLYHRLMTERLRQFHFQTMICLLPEIAASLQDPGATAQFEKRRDAAFSVFRRQMEGQLGAELAAVLQRGAQSFWFERPPTSALGQKDSAELEPLFQAYRALRIQYQASYARYMLREDGTLFSSAPRWQAATLEKVTFSCILLLLAIHIAVGTAIVAGWHSASPTSPLLSYLGAALFGVAVVALAARAFDQGLQPGREIERYQQYSSNWQAILDRFDAAPSQAEKLETMIEMERLAYDEMRNFLLTNYSARFVM